MRGPGSDPTAATQLKRRAFLGRLPLLAAVASGCRPRLPQSPPFRVSLPLVIENLDPHASSSTGAFTALGNTFEPLVFARGQGLRPGLASGWSSPDPLTVIFELRRGLRFHGGRPVEAKDVAYSYERCRSRADLGIGYYLGEVEAAEAMSRTALRIRTRRHAPALLSKLAHVFVIPEGSDPDRDRDGTGPYRIAGWDSERSLRLVRHDGYWGEPPALEEVELRLGVTDAEAERGLESGELQMALLDLAGEPREGASYAIQTRSTLHVKYLGFDLGHPTTRFASVAPNPFLDPRVRQAIHVGIDRERLVSRLPTRGVPANQLVPRDVFGFSPDLPPVAHDPERARSLLREAGLPGGFSATLHTRAILEETAVLVQRELAPLGIALEVAVLSDPEAFAAQSRHELSLWLDRWSCSTGESAELFETALHSRDEARGLGLFNESAYSDERLDAAIEAALELETPLDRGAALQALMAEVMRELPWVPLYSDEEVWGLQEEYAWHPGGSFWLHLQDIHRST